LLILRDARVQSFNVLQQRLNRKSARSGKAPEMSSPVRE
jgi:hypothetical protein